VLLLYQQQRFQLFRIKAAGFQNKQAQRLSDFSFFQTANRRILTLVDGGYLPQVV